MTSPAIRPRILFTARPFLTQGLATAKFAKAEITGVGKKLLGMARMLDMKSFFAGIVFGVILDMLLGIILEANFFFLI